ncbi:LAQU0S08e04148g1_1 [Lachancea quebecensis]|uniref:Monopolar spindle protein 2 n=1 Tax=Lachancea quebecensis TaxID=1654605 RepID=A0A0P1KVD4_9SACH|nr:LAQU0S08e04148g1_1 [Lachancea quebecensis]
MDTERHATLLLDLVWPEVDAKAQGFIYAKDFPLAVSRMEEILNRGKPDRDRAQLVSETGREILRKFGSDQEFFKVYKEDFRELFDGLVGTSFKSAVKSCAGDGALDRLQDNEITDEMHDKKAVTPTLQDEVLRLREQVRELSSKNVEKDQEIIARDEIIAELQGKDAAPAGSPRSLQRMRSLQARVTNLEEELSFRDEVIREKDRELLNFTKRVGEFKDKYQFLEREFQFYKGHREQKSPDSIKEATRHEFIISELKRKITEQSDMIGQMRAQVETKPGVLYSEGAASTTGFPLTFPLRLVLRLIIGAILAYLAFDIGIRSLKAAGALFGSSTPTTLIPKTELSWWEQNTLLSKLHWFFKEFFDNYDLDAGRDEVVSANYDKLFGV